MIAFARIDALVESACKNGSRLLHDGTILAGRMESVGEDAWLHILFAPRGVTGIREIERRIGVHIPDHLRELLLRWNGLSLFSDALAIYGLRTTYARTADAAFQPFSIETPNTVERPADAPKSAVFFGGYNWDGSLLYCMNGYVYRCDRDSASPLNEWNTLDEMLVREIERLMALFGPDGMPLHPSRPTTP